MHIPRSFAALAAASLSFCLVTPGPAPAAQEADVEQALATANALSTAFEHAADTVAPSVVNVRSAIRVSGGRQRLPDIPEHSPFRDFFERFGAPDEGRDWIRQGQGSGFIVSDDGLILTNNHVVADAEQIIVRLHDDRELEAELVGADPSTDLALIRIDANELRPVSFGDSDDLAVGEWVVAVGNPFALEFSITAGIVSAKGRSRVGIADYEDFIQTDAAINPGNSGGPLVNLRGEVVGVNTAIATRTGGNMGIGFAIPSALARDIMESLRESGTVIRGWLGVSIQDLTAGLAESFDYDGTDGALVSQVVEDSPAEEAGLRSGDIIVGYNGEPVRNVAQLRLVVAQTDPGEEAEVMVIRSGKERTFDVNIGELDAEAQLAAGGVDSLGDELGLDYRNLNEELAGRLGLDFEEGVVVTNVEPLSAAARAQLQPGDVIVEVQGEAVDNVRAFRRALADADLERGVRLTVRSAGGSRFVFLRLGEDDDE
jgi:serine protease Do